MIEWIHIGLIAVIVSKLTWEWVAMEPVHDPLYMMGIDICSSDEFCGKRWCGYSLMGNADRQRQMTRLGIVTVVNEFQLWVIKWLGCALNLYKQRDQKTVRSEQQWKKQIRVRFHKMDLVWVFLLMNGSENNAGNPKHLYYSTWRVKQRFLFTINITDKRPGGKPMMKSHLYCNSPMCQLNFPSCTSPLSLFSYYCITQE